MIGCGARHHLRRGTSEYRDNRICKDKYWAETCSTYSLFFLVQKVESAGPVLSSWQLIANILDLDQRFAGPQ
jgi:hypothetical protein